MLGYSLISENKISNGKKYEAVAFSLDNLNRENKDWICLEPAIFEDALEFLLVSHCMEAMVIMAVHFRKWKAGGCRARFHGRKIARHRNLIANFHGTGKRIIFLTLFQHNLNDNLQGLRCKELSRFLGMDMEEGNKFWVADAKLEPDGITLLSYQNITDRVLLS